MANSFSDRWLSDVPLVVFDCETTGLSPQIGHRVVEIGAVRLHNWQKVGEFSQLIQPDRKMSPGASAVNGITDIDLAGQPRFNDIADDLLELLAGALLVAHNASFDTAFLSNELSISSQMGDRKVSESILLNPWLCTLRLARRNFSFRHNSLDYIARQLGIHTARSHRALSDVKTTTEVLKYMVQELGNEQPLLVGDLILAQGGPIYFPKPTQIELPQQIRRALDNQLDLEILYAGGGSGRTRRIITPLYPTKQGKTTYIIAFCHMRQDRRTFRLDRILEMVEAS